MQNTKSEVANEDVLKTLKSSGYPLEQEIASILEKMGWDFTLNYAFTDMETNLSREVDVLALRRITVENFIRNSLKGKRVAEGKPRRVSFKGHVRLNAELIIECKKMSSPIVFFCRPKQRKDFLPSHADDIIQYSGVKTEIEVKPWNELSTWRFTTGQILRIGDLSHYANCKEKATQFCKISKAGKKIKADHAEIYQSFIVPLIKAVEYQKLAQKIKPTWRYFEMFLHYPLLVIEGEILKTNSECSSLEPVKHAELVRNYYSNKIGGTYRIDVVRKDYFPEFVEKILMPSVSIIEAEVRKRDKVIAKGKIRVRSVADFDEELHEV